jgi:phage-related protein
MPSVGPRCHELRIIDGDVNWRIVYRLDPEEILVLDVFAKKTRATPADVIDICKQRLRRWDAERG